MSVCVWFMIYAINCKKKHERPCVNYSNKKKKKSKINTQHSFPLSLTAPGSEERETHFHRSDKRPVSGNDSLHAVYNTSDPGGHASQD